MIRIIKSDSKNEDFILLVKELDTYQAEMDGDKYSFYSQFNNIETLQHVLVAYEDSKAVACGAIRMYDNITMEVKRMFTLPAYRGKGISGTILNQLEEWAKELGCEKCILETGKNQLSAIAFYKKMNYAPIPNYGQYEHAEYSLCFEKILTSNQTYK